MTKVPNYMKFVLGGLSGMTASTIVQPLDLMKTRMQITTKQNKGTMFVFRDILKTEGPLGFYSGISAALLRQATYTTTRLGLYTWLLEVTAKEGQNTSFATKTAFGLVAGICGAFVGTPADLALIRMTADGRLPPSERRNYKNVFDALFRILKKDGITGCWRGSVATMTRAMVVNATQLASYSQCKESFENVFSMRAGILLHFCASMASGLLTSIASMPVDIVKTRIQNMKSTTHDKPPNSIVLIGRIVKNEGVFALWKGFFPYYSRLGPHTVLTFIFLEQYTHLYTSLVS